MRTSMGYRVYQLESSQYQWDQGTVTFVLTCRNISYNGKIFGYETTMLGIESYEGIKSLEDLEVLPLYLHSEQEEIISQTTVRGKKFVDLQGWHYKAYQGIVTPADNRRRPRKIDSGRIVVDPDMYASQQGDSDRLTPLHAEPEAGPLPPPPPFDDPFAYPGDHHMNSRPRTKRRSSTVKVENAKENPGHLEEHQYRLCTSIVKGYDMTSKQWAMFHVNCISKIKFSTAAFRRLVLPHDYKELILAFVDSHLNKEDEFDDIIEGKGRGMIVLLHGSPGLGKTLTAEAVAEEMKVPLYAMSAGQLGFDVETMKYALQDVLDICAKWGAVLLLDEADVFLEQRQLTDLQRNRLVSIFLRVLEYYPGCLFLTTNRVNTFDLAFKSRIDLSIDYPKLDFHARRHIWSTFVRASEDFPQHHSSITDDELFDLAELDLNGREVKNLVKTGRLLAKRKGESLGMTHLLSVFSVQRGLPGDGSGFRLAVPDWFQSVLGKVIVQTTMCARRGISFN